MTLTRIRKEIHCCIILEICRFFTNFGKLIVLIKYI